MSGIQSILDFFNNMCTKVCKKCKLDLPLSEYRIHKSNKDGLTGSCKTCINKYQNYRYSITRKSTKIKKTKEEKREYYRQYQINKKKTDNLFKLNLSIRKLIYVSLSRKNVKKNTKTEIILGCSSLEFKEYIESKWESWMNWENYGKYNGEYKYGWDLDHIIPISSAKTKEDLIKLNYYTNFQPMCSKINRYEKKNKFFQ